MMAPLSRPAVLQAMATGVMGLLIAYKGDVGSDLPPSSLTYTPVAGAYADNPTVFGRILRGELPATIMDETETLIVFRDIHPRAPTHDLVIPKRRIGSVFDLERTDLELLEEMKATGLRQLEKEQPEALSNGDFRLVFHAPPFNSVDHIHLHVVAPASRLSLFHGLIKYRGEGRNCVTIDLVMRRLRDGKASVPFPRPSNKIMAIRRMF